MVLGGNVDVVTNSIVVYISIITMSQKNSNFSFIFILVFFLVY